MYNTALPSALRTRSFAFSCRNFFPTSHVLAHMTTSSLFNTVNATANFKYSAATVEASINRSANHRKLAKRQDSQETAGKSTKALKNTRHGLPMPGHNDRVGTNARSNGLGDAGAGRTLCRAVAKFTPNRASGDTRYRRKEIANASLQKSRVHYCTQESELGPTIDPLNHVQTC